MNGAAALLPKFFIICSVILIATGLGQYVVRPREPREGWAHKIVNRSTITALLSIVCGIYGLLLGLGVFKLPHLG